jgi:hypothetical protein
LKQKEKKAPIGAPGRIQHLNMAEGMGLTSNLLLWMPLGLQGISDRFGHVIERGLLSGLFMRLTWRRWPGW